MNIHIEGDHIKIRGSAIGEGNVVLNISEMDALEWEKLQAEILKALQRLPEKSAEYEAGSQALSSILKRDKQGLLSCVKEFAVSFSSSLFAGAAGPFLTEYIRRLIE